MPNNVIFLDRDGVINQDSPEYIKNWAEFFFIPKSLDAIRHLTQAGFDIIIASNQSGVGRGLIALDDLLEIHRNLVDQVRIHGGRIKDIFYCPHSPQENCTCRKPLPGLLFSAQKKYSIDLSGAILIGDSARDIQCGQNAGLKQNILVKTGNYNTAIKTLKEQNNPPDHVAADLFDAAHWIITN